MKVFFFVDFKWSGFFSASFIMLFLLSSDLSAKGNEFIAQPCSLDSVVISPPSCNALCDGEIRLYASCTTSLYYSWTNFPGIFTPVLSNICAGTYFYTITDSAGYYVTDSVVISEPPPVAFNIVSQGSSCPGGCTGSLTVMPLDTLTYTYYWPGYMSTDSVLTTLCQGTYNVIVTDMNGCSRIESADVSYIPPFELSFVSTPASCISSCNGTAAVIANGTPPFTYLWGTGPMQNTQTAFNLCVGSYLANVTDSIGCTVTDSVYIDQLAPVNIAVNAFSPTCFGGCDGVVNAIPGVPGNYSYVWNTSPQQFSSSATGLCAGIYTVTVTDLQSGCDFMQSVEILDPIPMSFVFDVTPSYCNNSCTGVISVTASSSPPFDYLWSTGSTVQSVSGLCPGIYTVTVTDSLGCMASGSASVGAEPLVLFSAPATCNNVCDGSAGLILPYPSVWNIDWLTTPVLHTENITDLCEGIYSVALVDSSGCQLNGSIEVIASENIQSIPVTNEVTCTGSCNGSINLIVSGHEPFQFEWNTTPVQFSDSISGLCAGSYIVTITDSIGCTLNDSILLSEPTPAEINYFIVPNSCATLCDAVIEAIPVSAANFTYQWLSNPVQTGSIATGLCPGLIYIEVTDSVGCVQMDSVMIVDTPPLNINFSVTGVSCAGVCDGFVVCQASGGQPGFTYEWANGFTTPQLINACPGTYTVTVTDVSGCTGEESVTLSDPDILTVTYNILPASCTTCDNGIIEAIPAGGTPPYFYVWNPGGIGGAVLDSLVPGWYNACVVDFNNCSYCEDVYVSDYSGLSNNVSQQYTVRLMPNPFSDKSVIIVEDGIEFANNRIEITIKDLSGRAVNSVSINNISILNNKLLIEISNSNAANGLYFFGIEVDDVLLYNGKFMIFND